METSSTARSSLEVMFSRTSLVAVGVACCCLTGSLWEADAFIPPSGSGYGRPSAGLLRMSAARESKEEAMTRREGWDRRGALASVLGVGSLTLLGLAGGPFQVQQAQAAVGEGGLPEVAESFNRILKTQREFSKVSKTIADREGKLEDQEWVNTQIFLRNSYLVGNDMRRLVRDADDDKRNKGNGIASEFEGVDKEMDRLCKSKDWQAFLRNNDQAQTLFRSFTDLLSDVPDEL